VESTKISPVDRTRPAYRTRQVAWSGTTGPLPGLTTVLQTGSAGVGFGGKGDGPAGGRSREEERDAGWVGDDDGDDWSFL